MRPLFLALAFAAGGAWAQQAVDVGQAVPDAAAVAEGLFPAAEDECEQLRATGNKCMGFKPAVRYSLPATAFKLGSADLPDALKKQLEVFAEVLKSPRAAHKTVRIEGHADASGAPALNLTLSQRRAEAVKSYLVSLGVDPGLLTPVGQGSNVPKNPQDPYAAENRRVEIGRDKPPAN